MISADESDERLERPNLAFSRMCNEGIASAQHCFSNLQVTPKIEKARQRGDSDEFFQFCVSTQIVFVKVAYFRMLSRHAGSTFPSRKDVPVKMCLDPTTLAKPDFKKKLSRRRLFVVSHPWLTIQHPDPSGMQLCQLVAELNGLHAWDNDVVFYDYCSLFQHDKLRLPPGTRTSDVLQKLGEEAKWPEPGSHPSVRTAKQEQLFHKALTGIERLYTSDRSYVIILPEVPEKLKCPATDGEWANRYNINLAPYIKRGWCFFEAFIAIDYGRVVNAGQNQAVRDLQHHVNLNAEGVRKLLQSKKIFSDASDRAVVLAMLDRLYNGTKIEFLAGSVRQHDWVHAALFVPVLLNMEDSDLTVMKETQEKDNISPIDSKDVKEILASIQYAAARGAGECVQFTDSLDSVAGLSGHPDEVVRTLTVQTLALFGSIAAPKIVRFIKDGHPNVRRVATKALGKMGEAAVPFAVAYLSDDVSTVRQAAVQVLGYLGELAEPHAPEIAELLQDSIWEVRQSAAQALGEIGKGAVDHASQLVLLLKDVNLDLRRVVADCLGKIGAGCGPFIVEFLDDEDWDVRRGAAEALGKIGRAAIEHVDDLAMLLKDGSCDVKRQAVESIGLMGPRACDHAKEIATLLKDFSPEMRKAASIACGRIGKAAVDYAGEYLDYPDRQVQRAAAEALGLIGPASVNCAFKLCQLLKEVVQLEALKEFKEVLIDALGRIGNAAGSHIKVLLKDKERAVREAGMKAFGKMNKEEATPNAADVAACLKDPSPIVRRLTAEVLGMIGSSAAPHAAKYLNDEERDARQAAADAMGKIGPGAAPYALKYMKNSRHAGTRASAAEALGNIGEAAAGYSSELKDRLKDPNPQMRRASLEALTKMGVDIPAEVSPR